MSQVRVRFAPSPTGGLHIGGVRTVLFNYLFARQQGGTFVLRIEDTDQSRFVPGAEQYIFNCLRWCGLMPDESVEHPGAVGPYRQSERKALYRPYAEQLIAAGKAYYAFDTPEELAQMREQFKTAENPSPQYGAVTRMHMRNSLTMDEAAVAEALNGPHVVRILMPQDERIQFKDMIRGEVSFDTGLVDDKVLLKADGMPTYHLAVVVDDYLMQISHVFRGEEWLPSAPIHLLLWRYLGWEEKMPQWAHLPLLLGPDGAKLSKRHGSKYGFPIFAMNWTDPRTGDFTEGFAERGFLPQALLNLLALLGWNDGSGQELFSMEELVQRFDISRVSHSGAVFDFEKARWFNHQHIHRLSAAELAPLVMPYLPAASNEKLLPVLELVKERCTLLPDFGVQAGFFFQTPESIDLDSLRAKWKPVYAAFFETLASAWDPAPAWENAADIETAFTVLAQELGIKKGELMLPLRIMLVGGKFGPGVFDILHLIGASEAAKRVRNALSQI
ncbi:MAG: glutamate--tRNA ligase [Bacteroidetes bacterium]|nr:glutamate--tRNA ligase [Bacteroidota bacterium]